MPLYEYKCRACSVVSEVLQSFGTGPLRKCPECGGKVDKLISKGGFILKGGGWYADGYSAPSAQKESGGSDSGSASDDEGVKATPDAGKDAPAAAAADSSKPAAAAASSDAKPAAPAKESKPAKAPPKPPAGRGRR